MDFMGSFEKKTFHETGFLYIPLNYLVHFFSAVQFIYLYFFCVTFNFYLILFLVLSQKLLQLPTVSNSIEVWDFLSIDSQVERLLIFYFFSLDSSFEQRALILYIVFADIQLFKLLVHNRNITR